MQFIQERRRLVLLVLVVVVLLCLVGVLAFNQFYGGRGGGVAADTPTPVPPTAVEEESVAAVAPEQEEEETPTPTRVIVEADTATPEATAVVAEATAEPSPAADTATPTGADFVPSPPDSELLPTVLETGDILKNGGFEEGFDDLGVGIDWQYFKTDGAIFSFSGETFETLIQDGSSAQRISVDQAFQADRYAGLYQSVAVVPDRAYTFTIYGQIRTAFGDVNQSGYGYRVQYAVDFEGGEDWQQVPEADWIELPWDEVAFDSADPAFSEYTTEIIPTADRMTLFVRIWNKWPDPGLVEYTLDSLSLVGPVPGTAVVSPATTEEAMIDRPLPVTGTEDITDFMGDARFWGAILVLLLLAVGAIYRARWQW